MKTSEEEEKEEKIDENIFSEEGKRRVELLSPSLDFAFKRLFGVESKKRMLICLLNSILKGDPEIRDIIHSAHIS
ncbi:MAG: Rpn family recombination-promoting nuclease/putative transposase [Rickettsiales bacterium]|jgi:hypothetical protein|nr:Rpn family recombination-promoting nuclease/putative transposase [Rickettsiales bacterium]